MGRSRNSRSSVRVEFHEYVSKLVGLLEAVYKYAMFLTNEPIRFSTKAAGLGGKWAWVLLGLCSAGPALSLGLWARA